MSAPAPATPGSGEFGRIARFFAPLAQAHPGALGLTDDAAIVSLAAGERFVVTTDALVAGVHFVGDEPPDLIARKALRVNVSDLAAMGARAHGYTLVTILPRAVDDAWLAQFAAGLAADQAALGIVLLGGDTVATPGPLTLVVTALGIVGAAVLTRGGAKPGDAIYVSGTIGDAAMGLACLTGGLGALDPADRAFLVDRYRLPQPRIGLGERIVGVASAGLDISDGLVGDLGHIAATSGVGAELALEAIPLSPAGRAAVAALPAAIDQVLAGGDDYELLFTAPPERDAAIRTAAAAAQVPVTAIGRIVGGSAVVVRDAGGRDRTPALPGYQHF